MCEQKHSYPVKRSYVLPHPFHPGHFSSSELSDNYTNKFPEYLLNAANPRFNRPQFKRLQRHWTFSVCFECVHLHNFSAFEFNDLLAPTNTLIPICPLNQKFTVTSSEALLLVLPMDSYRREVLFTDSLDSIQTWDVCVILQAPANSILFSQAFMDSQLSVLYLLFYYWLYRFMTLFYLLFYISFVFDACNFIVYGVILQKPE